MFKQIRKKKKKIKKKYQKKKKNIKIQKMKC